MCQGVCELAESFVWENRRGQGCFWEGFLWSFESVRGRSRAVRQVGKSVSVRRLRVKVFGLGGDSVRVRWSVLRAWAVLGLKASGQVGDRCAV